MRNVAREHSLDGNIARINDERQGYQTLMQRPDNARFLQQVQLLNQLFDQKAFSWTLAMQNLETVLPGGVQVTQIEPARAKNGQITLHLRVLGPHNLGDDLVRNLEHSHRFISPRIEGENAETSNSAFSRNQVLETRDWNLTNREEVSLAGIRGGVVVAIATPPSFTNLAALYSEANTLAAEYTAPSHVPGVPESREHRRGTRGENARGAAPG